MVRPKMVGKVKQSMMKLLVMHRRECTHLKSYKGGEVKYSLTMLVYNNA